jgi:DNA-directed RNA polymerase subunit beta
VTQDHPIYLSAEEEDMKMIAQANAELKENGAFATKRVKARQMGDFPVVEPKELS